MLSNQVKHILVVDDQPNWRELLNDVFESAGCEVMTVTNSGDAHKLLQQSSFDLAIMDMRLIDDETGNLEGMWLLKEAKALYPSMKAVILTGYSEEPQRIKAIEYYKADGYFEKAPGGKPMDIENFRENMLALLQ
jgi:two-component system, NtrC family, response regulator